MACNADNEWLELDDLLIDSFRAGQACEEV